MYRRGFRSLTILAALLASAPVSRGSDEVPSPLLENAGAPVELEVAEGYSVVHPLAAALAGGGSVALWQIPDRHGDPPNLESRLFDSEGREIARRFLPGSEADSMFIAAQPGGGFTIVASLFFDDGWSQRFDPQGRPRTEPFTFSETPMTISAIAAGRAGGFLALSAIPVDAASQDLYLTSYGTYGRRLAKPLRINQALACREAPPVLASDAFGRAVVVWKGPAPQCDRIFLRRTDTAGRPRGEVLEAVAPAGPIGRIAVAAAPNGWSVVAWEGEGDGDGLGIFARSIRPNGQPSSAVFQVNRNGQGNQTQPRVAVQGDGRFFVVWLSPGEEGHQKIQGQYFAADTRPLGSDFLIDPEVLHLDEMSPSLATDAAGRYVVIWGRYTYGIFYRRFPAPR
jgi:hypothetical protein